MSTPQKETLFKRAFNSINNDTEGTLAYLVMVILAGAVVFAFAKGFFS